MTEKDILELLIKKISENFFQSIGLFLTSILTIVSGTWLLCKNWYRREIDHLKNSKTSECQLLNEQIKFLNQKLQDNNSYAKGIIEMAKKQLEDTNKEIVNISSNSIIDEYEDKIKLIKKDYDESIDKLEKEKNGLYELLKSSKTDKSKMLNRLFIIIAYSEGLNINKAHRSEIKLCYSDLITHKDDDNFYVVYSKFSSLLSDVLILNYDSIKRENKEIKINFITSKANSFSHMINIFKPIVHNKDKSEIDLKQVLEKLKKTIKGNSESNLDTLP